MNAKGPSIKDVSPNFKFLRYPPSPCLPMSPLALRPLGETSPQAYPPLLYQYGDLSVNKSFLLTFFVSQ